MTYSLPVLGFSGVSGSAWAAFAGDVAEHTKQGASCGFFCTYNPNPIKM
jgi:hypothetical protein